MPRVAAYLGGLAGQARRGLGPRLQAAHRRHARGAGDRRDRGAAGGRRRGRGLRPQGRAERARGCFGDRVTFCGARLRGASSGADALVVVTEWNEFREPDFAKIRSLMRRPGDLRRPQHLRPAPAARARLPLRGHRPAVSSRGPDRPAPRAARRPAAERGDAGLQRARDGRGDRGPRAGGPAPDRARRGRRRVDATARRELLERLARERGFRLLLQEQEPRQGRRGAARGSPRRRAT